MPKKMLRTWIDDGYPINGVEVYEADDADRDFEEIVRWAIRTAYEREPHWSVHRLTKEAKRRWRGEEE